jgi:hypothetical protein
VRLFHLSVLKKVARIRSAAPQRTINTSESPITTAYNWSVVALGYVSQINQFHHFKANLHCCGLAQQLPTAGIEGSEMANSQSGNLQSRLLRKAIRVRWPGDFKAVA